MIEPGLDRVDVSIATVAEVLREFCSAGDSFMSFNEAGAYCLWVTDSAGGLVPAKLSV